MEGVNENDASPILFTVNPTIAKFQASSTQTVMLNIQSKLKNSFFLGFEASRKANYKHPIEMYSHLLIGKVKDTNMMFSFFIEASIYVDKNKAAAE